jgi:hypothetical protein
MTNEYLLAEAEVSFSVLLMRHYLSMFLSPPGDVGGAVPSAFWCVMCLSGTLRRPAPYGMWHVACRGFGRKCLRWAEKRERGKEEDEDLWCGGVGGWIVECSRRSVRQAKRTSHFGWGGVWRWHESLFLPPRSLLKTSSAALLRPCGSVVCVPR